MDTVLAFITALGSLAGAAVAALALWQSGRANRAADEANAKSQEILDRAEAREQEREKRMIAGSLQCWWGRRKDGVWGVVVSNNSPYSGVFRDVEIELTDPYHKEITSLSMKVVPPGSFFCFHTWSKEWKKRGWEFPVLVQEVGDIQPATQSNQHKIHSVIFTDQTNTKWQWSGDPRDAEGNPASGDLRRLEHS